MARIHEHTVNIAAPLTLVRAIPLAMQGDAEADALILHVVNGKESADMTGYAVGGYLERADGIRVMLKGSVTADMVEVKLQEACYRVPGAYKAFVRLTKTTGEKMTLFLFAGRIEGEGDGEIVDEEDTLPSVEELIAMIEEIDRAIAEANEARDDANAAATGADAAAAEALKAAENAGKAEKAANDAAYEANAAADAADEAAVGASAWAKATMEAESLPEGSEPTISVEKNVNGGNVIRVGIPAGKTGKAGETGATPQITFEVETGAAGTDVKVEQSGTAEAPHIKLTIPRGDTGAVEGVDYYEGDPAPLGTASPGTANGVARGNHVHPVPTAEQVGARPDNWMPTAEQVGAQPAGNYALKSEIPAAYTLPTATANTLGGVKSSDAVTVNADGTMTVNQLNGKSAEYYATAESVSQLSQQKVDKTDVLSLEEIQASNTFDGKVASASAAYELGRKGTKRGFEGWAQAVPIKTWTKTNARVFLEKGGWLFICNFFRDQGGLDEFFRVYLGVGTGETYDDDSLLGGFSGNWASVSPGGCDLWVPSDAYYNIFVKHESEEAHKIDIRGSFIRL